MTALTLFLTETASTTVSTADTLLENASTSTSFSNKNTNMTSGTTGWVEVFSQGATTQTGAGSEFSPTGHGWCDDNTTLVGNHFPAGTWTFTLGFETTTTGTFTADFHFRAYQRSSGGTYTLICEAIQSGQSIVSTSYTVLNTSVSASASNTFVTGDKLYIDCLMNITTNGTTGNMRMQASSSATLGWTSAQVVTPGYVSVTTSTRTATTSAVLQSTLTRTATASAVLQSTLSRTATTSAVLLSTLTRTATTSAVLSGSSRVAPTSAVLQSTLTRTATSSAVLTFTSSRTAPTSAALSIPSVFYASNVAATLGGLTLSDQMSQVIGGTETSFTVTMPSSGTSTYVELLAQGGTSSGTSALPAPTGKGWSINLQGNTILAGDWYSVFTLAKAGTSMSGASLIVRWYRRTMDGTYYTIGLSTLSGQTFSTTKASHTTPTVTVNFPWQFISNDTLYVDAFVFNGSTAWSSDVFTVYVSNSASVGVANDGTMTAPEMIATPNGLSCMVGAGSFRTGTGIPVKNESFTLMDMIDQRSVLNLIGKDVDGTFSFTPNMPVILSDSTQGKIYDGYLAADQKSKVSADSSIPEREHKMTFADHHRDYDKEANGVIGTNTNGTNYSNWTAGDIACDFIDKVEDDNGIWGEYAIEADYSQAAFALGTLSGTTATSTTSPFVYAPNTASPPITTNTGSLELTRAGTQFTLTEQTTSDFSSGTLTNMTATSNTLVPTTQSAFEVVAQFPLAYGSNNNATNILNSGTPPPFFYTWPEDINNAVTIQIWSGSKTIASTDTLNYDIWISSTSPEFKAGIDFTCSDGTTFSASAAWTNCIGGTTGGIVGYYDSNTVSADILTDLSNYAKDAWYTRSIQIAGTMPGSPAGTNSPSLAGKSITSVSVCLWGASTGTYTAYVKNIYLGSASGSPFFSTTATSTNVSPPAVATIGGYVNSGVVTNVVTAYLPQASYRISPAHSISSVGLVQNSTITWTASLPTTGPSNTLPVSALNPTSANTQATGTASAMAVQVSYDNKTWLTCVNNGSLPGLPAGANVSGVSLYLREYFQAGSDPTAIPALVQVNITINSAANQTTTDVVANYGNATDWNTGTFTGTQTTSGGQLTTGASFSPAWGSSSTTGQTLFMNIAGSITNSASSGTYTMTGATSSGLWGQSRFDFAGDMTNGIIQADLSFSTTSSAIQAGIMYRSTSWLTPGNNQDTNLFAYYVWISGNTSQTFGSHVEWGVGGNSSTTSSYTTLGTSGVSLSANTFYTIKIQFVGNRHIISLNGTEILDGIDNTILTPGGVGLRMFNASGTNGLNIKARNCTIQATSGTEGVWTSPSTSISSLGTCGNTQINWTEENSAGDTQSTALVLTSIDGGSSYQQCTNGGAIPGLTVGTNVSGKSVITKMILYGPTSLSTPIIYGLNLRICGTYGTVSGTRISPVFSLTPVGYVASSNCAWHANTPTNTSVSIQTTQDLSTYHTVGSGGAGEALPYWTNQPGATQDLFSTNTSANYTSTAKSGGSAASVYFDTANSRVEVTGGSSALYLNSTINCADIDLLVDMDESDSGGLCWHVVDTSNYYELGVYDASSSGGFTNQLRLYKVSSGTRSLLGSASTVTFTRSVFHRIRVMMKAGLINVYWDGQCKQSYLDTSALGAGQCGLRNDGGTSRYYQLWVQPLGTNASGQVLYTKATLTTSDPTYMPQLFTLLCCVRGPSIGTGATIAQLHPPTQPFAAYYSAEMDAVTQQSGDSYWYVSKWKQFIFGPRFARPGAFPLQGNADAAGNGYSGVLLYQPMGAPPVTVTNSADPLRNQQIMTNVSGLVTPPPVALVADGNTTSWSLGYPVYSAPTITINGSPATIGVQGIDSGKQLYWQPGSVSINYDSSLPKLPSGTVLNVTYIGQSPVNTLVSNSSAITTQAAIELNSGRIAEIESALTYATNSTLTVNGMNSTQAQTFAQGLLSRFGNNNPSELIGTTLYAGLAPGTVAPVFIPELDLWNTQLPITKVTTIAFQSTTGIVYLYSVDCTNGANQSQWMRVWY